MSNHIIYKNDLNLPSDNGDKEKQILFCRTIIDNPENLPIILKSADNFNISILSFDLEKGKLLEELEDSSFVFNEIYYTHQFIFEDQSEIIRRFISFKSSDNDFYLIFIFSFYMDKWNFTDFIIAHIPYIE